MSCHQYTLYDNKIRFTAIDIQPVANDSVSLDFTNSKYRRWN